MKVFFTLLLFLLTFRASAQSNLLPCDFDLGADVTVCNNAIFKLNPHPIPGGTYSWTGGPGLSCYNCPTPTVSGLSTGIYTYIATVTTADCTASDTLLLTVVNGEAPQYEIIENTGMCMGDSIALGGQEFPGVFYNWFSVPAGFVSSLANPNAKPSAHSTYYLSVSNAGCPVPSLDSVKVTPTTLNLVLLPMDTVKICQGQSRTFQATTGPAGQAVNWSPIAGLQISSNGATAVAGPTESTLYTATAMLGGCTRQSQIYVAVDSLPKGLGISPTDTTICQGEKVLLHSNLSLDPFAFPKITFKWTPALGLLSPDSLFNLAVQPNVTTLYKRITKNGVCADTVQAWVRVIPAAQMTVSPAQSSICPGDTVSLSLTYTPGVTGITWTPTAGLSCTGCDNPVAQPTMTTNYTASGAFQGCPVSASATVNIKPLAPLKFPSDVLLCPGDSVKLNEVFDPAASYTWTSTHPGFGTVTKPDPSFTPTQTATYYVTADNGCVRKDSIRIFVSTATLTVDGDTTICKNFSTQLSASSNLAGNNFQWRNDLTGQIIGATQVITVNPAVTTPYTVIFTYGDNCQLSGQVLVTISGEAPELVFPSDTKLCPGENLTLNSGPVLPGAMYNWVANPPDPTLTPGSAAPMVTPIQNTIYSVTATLGNCTVSKQVEVSAFNATLNTSPDTTICSESQITLTASGSNPNGSYSWSTGSSNASITIMPTISIPYTITYTYGDNCKLTKTIQVTVVPGFTLSIQCVPVTNQVNIGESVTLTAVVNPPQNLSNFKFQWQETTVDTKLLPFGTESIDVVPSSNDTTVALARYTLTVTSPNGCVKIADKNFKLIFPIVRFPNAFTPDGDGNNDVFKMVVPQGLAIVDLMEIYNRWGQKIFESTAPNASWDGTINGEQVPSDVYIYRVWWRRGDGALQMQSKGDITLLR